MRRAIDLAGALGVRREQKLYRVAPDATFTIVLAIDLTVPPSQ